MFSSRLRTLIIVAVGGVVLVFGAVSIARSLELAGAGRRAKEKPARHAGISDTEAPQQPEIQAGQLRRRERLREAPSDVDLGLLGGSHRVSVPDREYRT